MTEEQTQVQFGQELAAKCNFNKDQILAVAFQALEDANYHVEAAQVLDMID
jgi:hypothetical protein